MNRTLKNHILWLGRCSGLFLLSRFVMRRKLLILCFHGFELDDESQFRPKLFMRASVFRSHLEIIRRHNFKVLSLSEAIERLDRGTLPNNSVVITIDDGFASTLMKAVPLLQQFRMPATLYQTTYYMDKPAVFRLVVQYMFWKTTVETLDATDEPGMTCGKVLIQDANARDTACWAIIDYGENKCSEQQRQETCHRLGALLGVDYGQIVRSRILSLLTSEEIKALDASGIDVQLHTHRHRLPDDEAQVRREIEDNRKSLSAAIRGPLVHLCYPSGIWNPSQFPWLEAEGIMSATTCQDGFNTAATNRLALHRFLDEDGLSSIEFEGKLCGFQELLRIVTGRGRHSAQVKSPDPVAPERAV